MTGTRDSLLVPPGPPPFQDQFLLVVGGGSFCPVRLMQGEPPLAAWSRQRVTKPRGFSSSDYVSLVGFIAV